MTKQTIKEVWNSPRALELAFPKKRKFQKCRYLQKMCYR
ncbi:MAG: hypothetical protein LBE11_01820 [Prevotellaceae bacterium]|nr:hypothetical protein [Prevotellaceae bacterium]